MKDYTEMDQLAEELYSHAIGKEVVRWAKKYDPQLLATKANSDAVALLQQIKAILDDETLTDSDCFLRIDAIVSAFYRAGIYTERHWEADG